MSMAHFSALMWPLGAAGVSGAPEGLRTTAAAALFVPSPKADSGSVVRVLAGGVTWLG